MRCFLLVKVSIHGGQTTRLRPPAFAPGAKCRWDLWELRWDRSDSSEGADVSRKRTMCSSMGPRTYMVFTKARGPPQLYALMPSSLNLMLTELTQARSFVGVL